MIGVCWNVRGLGNPCTFGALKRLLKKVSPDLVFLSETKLHKYKADKMKDVLGFQGGFSVPSKGRSGGLILLWSEDADVTVLSYSDGHIDARIKMQDGFLWRFSDLYGNPDPLYRKSS